MKQVAFIHSTEIHESGLHIPDLDRFSRKQVIRSKLFHSGSSFRMEDFSGDREELPMDITAEELAKCIVNWGAKGAISFSTSNEDALRDAVAGELLMEQKLSAVSHPAKTVHKLSNRWETKVLFQRFDLRTPSGILLDGDLLNARNVSPPAYRELILRTGASIGYPLMTKPLWDSLGRGIQFHRSPAELEKFLKSPYDGSVVMEKAIEGELCSVEIVGRKGSYEFRPIIWKGPIRSNDSSSSSDTWHIAPDFDVEKKLNKNKLKLVALLDYLDINGTVNVEMTFSDCEFYFTEIKPHISSTTILSDIAFDKGIFELLHRMLLDSWGNGEVKSRDANPLRDIFIQFSYKKSEPSSFRKSDFKVIREWPCERGGWIYRNAVISTSSKQLPYLIDFVKSSYLITDNTEDRLTKISRLKR